MRTPSKLISIASLVAVMTAAGAALAAPSDGAARQSMERCVASVLNRLARARAPESAVGSAVLAQCEGPLRATLAEAIRNGEAAFCTVESCIGLARARASEEAVEGYREQLGRRARL